MTTIANDRSFPELANDEDIIEHAFNWYRGQLRKRCLDSEELTCKVSVPMELKTREMGESRALKKS